MMRNVTKNVLAVGLALCMVAVIVLVTPPVAAWGYEDIVPFGIRPNTEEED